jgi:hypothetical protein
MKKVLLSKTQKRRENIWIWVGTQRHVLAEVSGIFAQFF